MADIELVIKIPEEIRLALINNIQLSLDQQSICNSCIEQAIINGKPLSKWVDGEPAIDERCKECKKDWTKCGRCPVSMKWVKEHKSEVENDKRR